MKNDNTPAAAPSVHRYTAVPQGKFKLKMPIGAEILDVTIGSKGLNLFALVDTTAAMEWRYFTVVPTGHAIPHGWEMNFVKIVPIGGPALHLFATPKAIAKTIGFKTFMAGVKAPD